VAERIRTLFPQVVQVYVTSDPASVANLARISGDVRRGVPINTHMDRLNTMMKALRPVVTPGTAPGMAPGGVPGGTTAPGTPGGTR